MAEVKQIFKMKLVLIAIMALSLVLCNSQTEKVESAEQVALNCMNALVELDYNTASKYVVTEVLNSESWQGFIDYCKSIANGTPENRERGGDLVKLREHRKEGCVLKIFKGELFNYENEDSQFDYPFEADQANKALVWMGNYLPYGEETDSGRVFLTKEGVSWKVVWFDF